MTDCCGSIWIVEDEIVQRVRDSFGDKADDVLELLIVYGSEPYHREITKVRHAILDVSGRNVNAVRYFVEAAIEDYVYVLDRAEHPRGPESWDETRRLLGLPPEGEVVRRPSWMQDPSDHRSASGQFNTVVLKGDSNVGYLRQPLPNARDSEISDLLEEARSGGQLDELAAELAPSHAASLLCFAQRMSVLAVRRSDPSLLDRAVVALCLAVETGDDDRDVLLVFPLPWRSAELLGLEPEELFTVSLDGLAKGRDALEAFKRRTPKDRRIEAMGYAESENADGFTYIRNW
jgi:hypothetical protein